MRSFEKVGQNRVQSPDGVVIYSVDGHSELLERAERYERPDRYCDVYRGWGQNREGQLLTSIDLQGPLRTGREGPRRQGIFWTLPDGSKVPVTEAERLEMAQDFVAAFEVRGVASDRLVVMLED